MYTTNSPVKSCDFLRVSQGKQGEISFYVGFSFIQGDDGDEERLLVHIIQLSLMGCMWRYQVYVHLKLGR